MLSSPQEIFKFLDSETHLDKYKKRSIQVYLRRFIDLNTDNDILNKQCEDLEKTNTCLNSRYETIIMENIKLVKEIKTSKKDLFVLEKNYNELLKYFNEMDEKYDALEEEYYKLKKQNEKITLILSREQPKIITKSPDVKKRSFDEI
jgi:chromosome segregation ATPase